MKKKIVYAPSYASLSFVLSSIKLDEIHVITPNNTMIEFCEVMNISHQKINSIEGGSLLDLKIHKKYLFDKAKEINGESIFFGFYGYDIWGLYFIKQLSKKNKIYFKSLDFLHPEIKPFSLLKFKNRSTKIKDLMILRILTALPLKVFMINKERTFYGLKIDQILRFSTVSNIKVNKQVRAMNRAQILNLHQINSCKYIFIDQGSSIFDLPKTLINTIINYLPKNELLIKEHPNHAFNIPELDDVYDKVPKYIPVELISDENTVFIGVVSTSLTANENSISLTNLVEWRDPASKDKYESLVLNDQIVKPKSILELITLLTN